MLVTAVESAGPQPAVHRSVFHSEEIKAHVLQYVTLAGLHRLAKPEEH